MSLKFIDADVTSWPVKDAAQLEAFLEGSTSSAASNSTRSKTINAANSCANFDNNRKASEPAQFPAIFYPAGCVSVRVECDWPECGGPFFWTPFTSTIQVWEENQPGTAGALDPICQRSCPRITIGRTAGLVSITVEQQMYYPWDTSTHLGASATVDLAGRITYTSPPNLDTKLGQWSAKLIETLATLKPVPQSLGSEPLLSTLEVKAGQHQYSDYPIFYDCLSLKTELGVLRLLVGSSVYDGPDDEHPSHMLRIFTDDAFTTEAESGALVTDLADTATLCPRLNASVNQVAKFNINVSGDLLLHPFTADQQRFYDADLERAFKLLPLEHLNEEL